MEPALEPEKGLSSNEKTPDLEKAPSCQDGTTTVVSSGVDDAGFRRQLGKRQIMMMTFGAGIGTGLWVSAIFVQQHESILIAARLELARHSSMPDQVVSQW